MPKGEIIRLFKECTKPKEQGKPTKKNVVSGNNNVIVMDSKSVNITINKTQPKTIKVLKNSSHIDDHTAYRIKELVDNLVLKETTGGMTSQKAYSKWYGALKKRYKVPSYSLIPSELGEAAISWLMTQAAIKRTKISRSNIPMYRNELYTAIYARAKNLNISKGELYQIVLEVLNKNVSSLTQLNESNLKKLYQYIMHL